MSCSVCLFLVSFCDKVIQYPRSKQEFSTYTSTYRRTAWNYVVKHSFMVCLHLKISTRRLHAGKWRCPMREGIFLCHYTVCFRCCCILNVNKPKFGFSAVYSPMPDDTVKDGKGEIIAQYHV